MGQHRCEISSGTWAGQNSLLQLSGGDQEGLELVHPERDALQVTTGGERTAGNLNFKTMPA